MLPVVDLDRARRFYEGRLNLSVIESMSGPDSIVYSCGQGTALGLYQRATPTIVRVCRTPT